MSNQSLEVRVHHELERAVQSGLLPENTQEQAKKLLARLEAPVRLALMGMPQSGKSSILNLLVGQDIIPSDVRLPTLELVYGADEQAICTLSDGSKTTLNGVVPDAIAALSPAFVELRMPLPALKKISVLEVVAPSDPNALHRASQWAAKRCDIALWCTGGYSANEQRIWSQMPDRIKDHGLLMVTRLDVLQRDRTVDDVLAGIRAAASGEFNKILPIATEHALAARQRDGSVDKDILRQSGGMALISAVLKQVDQGRRSAVDLAEVLLLQNEDALSDIDQVLAAQEAATAEAPVDQDDNDEVSETIPPVELADEAEDASLNDLYDGSPDMGVDDAPTAPSRATMSPMRRRDEPRQPLTDTAEAERVAVGITRLRNIAARRAEEGLQPAPLVELLPDTRKAYEVVITRLEENATSLSDEITQSGDDAYDAVMDRAVDDLNWLCDYLNSHGDEGDSALQRARDTAFDAADLVQLMQMEKRDSAAIEALSLVLQVKRELQADLAA